MRPSKLTGSIRRVAVVNPLNDYGIAGYTHEFAEGLAANGYLVSVYSDINAPLQKLPEQRNYKFYPVLGKPLLKQVGVPRLGSPIRAVHSAAALNNSGAAPLAHGGLDTASSGTSNRLREWLRVRFLSYELASYLHIKSYDLVWTQWYSPDVLDSAFWRACRNLQLPVVHTVHNVLPHEPAPGDWAVYNQIYAISNLLIVHSRHSQSELSNTFPLQAAKSIVMPHGTYASLHNRIPGSREQVRSALGIEHDSPVFLFCGAIRPYKNIEAVLEALACPEFSDVTLVIAGKESKYGGSNPSDPLGRTRELLAKFPVASQVKLIPRMLETAELSELLEACDALLLPYVKGYGSGLLLLGITFGKHIVATAAGGSEEYLRHYENHTLLAGPSAAEVALGLRKAVDRIRSSNTSAVAPLTLSWPYVTGKAMEHIERRLAYEN